MDTQIIHLIHSVKRRLSYYINETQERLKNARSSKYIAYDLDALECWLMESKDNFVFEDTIRQNIYTYASTLQLILETELEIYMQQLKSVVEILAECQKNKISIKKCISMITKLDIKKIKTSETIPNTYIGQQFIELTNQEYGKELIIHNIVNILINKIVDLKYRPYDDMDIKHIKDDDTEENVLHKRYLYRMQLIGITIVKIFNDKESNEDKCADDVCPGGMCQCKMSPDDTKKVIDQMYDCIAQSKTLSSKELHALWTKERKMLSINNIDFGEFKIKDLDNNIIDSEFKREYHKNPYIWIMTREFIIHKLHNFFVNQFTKILDTDGHFFCCDGTDNLRKYPDIQTAIYDDLVWRLHKKN